MIKDGGYQPKITITMKLMSKLLLIDIAVVSKVVVQTTVVRIVECSSGIRSTTMILVEVSHPRFQRFAPC